MAGRSCHRLPAQVGDFEPAQDKASSMPGSKLGATFVARAQDCPSLRGIWLGAQVTVTCTPVQGLRGQGEALTTKHGCWHEKGRRKELRGGLEAAPPRPRPSPLPGSGLRGTARAYLAPPGPARAPCASATRRPG